jgi:DNA modification methylase
MSSISSNSVICGDTREALRGFPSDFFDLVITSPPYYNLREYTDDPREIGREESFADFLNNLTNVFSICGAHMKKSGSLWVNIGDTYKGSPLMIPERFCLKMVDLGWCLINKVIWMKPDAMAESVTRRFSQKYEMFYWFVKDYREYYFNLEATKIPVSRATVERLEHRFNEGKSNAISRMRGVLGDMSEKVDMYLEKGVNCGDVWIIPTNKVRVKHAAPYPEQLLVRPLVACCPDGGNVLDPFAGSGTTGVATLRLGGGRTFYGIDINPQAVEEANARLKPLREQGVLL